MRGLICALGLLLGAAAAAEPYEGPQLRVNGSGHHAAVRSLASDASGHWLLTASDDKTARLWRDGKLRAVMRPPIGPGNEGKLYTAALSPDAQVAAVAGWSEDNAVYLFRTTDGQLISRISGLPNVVNQLAFSPDGKMLAVLLWGNHGLQVWHSTNAWRTPAFSGADAEYTGSGYGLAFSADGQRLATSAHDGRVRLYALRGGSPWRLAQRQIGGLPHGLQFSPDGQWLALGFADRPEVQVLRAEELAPAKTLRQEAPAGQPSGLHAVAWSQDGRQVLAAGSWRLAPGQHALLRWSASDGRSTQAPAQLATDTVTHLLRLPTGQLAYAAADASWGFQGGVVESAQRTNYRAQAGALRVGPDGQRVQAPGWAQGFDLAAFGWRGTVEGGAASTERQGLQVQDWRDGQAPRVNGKPIVLESGEQSLTVALHPSLPQFALGSAWMLRWLDAQGREIWRQALEAPCFALTVSADGRWLLAGLGDGTLRWLRTADGEERLALYNEGRAWVAWTPEGRYAAGEEGEALVGWHLNRGADRAAEFLPLARFAEKHYDPAAVLSALQAQPMVALRPLPDLRQGVKVPPKVTLQGPDAGVVEQDHVRLRVLAQDQGGGVDEVRLYLNGKLVQAHPARALRRLGQQVEGQWDVKLEPGPNRLRALALGSDRTESAPAELTLQLAQAARRPTLHGLAVGINQYRNRALNLSYSVTDARGVAGLMRQAGPKLFSDIKVTELLDAAATKAGILGQLQALNSSAEDDVVVVYLAGHGETIGDDWYFIPHELTQPEQADRLKAGGLSSRELSGALRSIPARKVVVLIDACKSGAAAGGFSSPVAGTRGLEERRVLAQLSRATGTHLIAATTKEQLASELDQLGHGVFTYVLLQGLSGKAAAGGNDITARKLMVYVEQALPELSKRFRAEEQFPVVNSTGMDFPIAVK